MNGEGEQENAVPEVVEPGAVQNTSSDGITENNQGGRQPLQPTHEGEQPPEPAQETQKEQTRPIEPVNERPSKKSSHTGSKNRKGKGKTDMLRIMAGFSKDKTPLSSIAIVFIIVPLLAIAIAPTFEEEEVKAFGDNEDSYVNPLIYLVLIVCFTFLILMIVKYFRKEIIQYIILGAFFMTMIYAFYPLLTYAPISKDMAVIIGTLFSAILTILLVKHPEWYVVDATGIAVAVGVTAIVGISFAPGPILLLMVILAIYDAISVYKTKHMIDLADSVMEFNLPVLLVVPKSKDYSFRKKDKGLKEQIASGEERDALFIGLGDIIFPSAFAVSLSVYLADNLSKTEVFGFDGIGFVVAGVIIGTLIGYAALMTFVLKGNPQAGLPLLNGGAIMGYIIPVLAIYQSLGLW